MTSIRHYQGEIRLCGSCGQPCGLLPVSDDDHMWQHFREQWDGVHCPWFPGAGKTIAIDWDPMSLATLQAKYPDTYPRG